MNLYEHNMITPVIISLVALLLFVAIGYNIIQQYKDKLAIERRISIAKQRAIISEVDELLLNPLQIPFSKPLILIMHQRIRNSLVVIINNSPSNVAMRDHLKRTDTQIQQIRESYATPRAETFKCPDLETESRAMLQITKKLSAVIRSEHAKGKISTDAFVAENYRFEIIQLKIHLQNGVKKITEMKQVMQFNSASNMINKFLKVLSTIKDEDSFLALKKNELITLQKDIKMLTLQSAKKTTQEQEQQKNTEKQDDLGVDSIFQDKKKW